ncbi:hypothetical protein P7K49_003851, partial [Saguinus oedipus]
MKRVLVQESLLFTTMISCDFRVCAVYVIKIFTIKAFACEKLGLSGFIVGHVPALHSYVHCAFLKNKVKHTLIKIGACDVNKENESLPKVKAAVRQSD